MKDYVDKCAVTYEPPTRHGYLCLPVLSMLNGKPWDEVALAFVHSLRPSYIRVIGPGGCETSDARTWRVTVRLRAPEGLDSEQWRTLKIIAQPPKQEWGWTQNGTRGEVVADKLASFGYVTPATGLPGRATPGKYWMATSLGLTVVRKTTIKEVVQEVEVGLPERVPHGHALQDALKFGIESPQLDWHRLPGTVFYGFGEYSKITADGHVPYPRPEKE